MAFLVTVATISLLFFSWVLHTYKHTHLFATFFFTCCFFSSFIFSPSFQGGLIGGGLLGLDNDGGYVNYDNESRGTESGWSNAFESEMGRDADELEEEDTLPEVELPQEQTALEIEKTEQRAHNLLNLVRRLKVNKRRKVKRPPVKKEDKKGNFEEEEEEEDEEEKEEEQEEEFSDDEISLIDWDLLNEEETEEAKKKAEDEAAAAEEKEETASQMLAAMDEMEVNPEELKKRKERAEQDSHPVHQLPLCLACKVRNHIKREAARLCHGCNLPYCVQCYRLSHRKGREKFHRWTNYEHKLVTCAVEETRKLQDYDDQLLKHLERVNPRQYRRKKAITKFRWTDGLLQVAGQIFLDRDPHNTGELDMVKKIFR